MQDNKKYNDSHSLWLLPQPIHLNTKDHGWLHRHKSVRNCPRIERYPGPDHDLLDCLIQYRNRTPEILHYEPRSDAELAAYAHYLGDPSVKPDTASVSGKIYDFIFLRGQNCLEDARKALSAAAERPLTLWVDTESSPALAAIEDALVGSHAVLSRSVHPSGHRYDLVPTIAEAKK